MCNLQSHTGWRIFIRKNPVIRSQNRTCADINAAGTHNSGPKGRRFKSCHLDQISTQNWIQSEWSSFLPQKAQKPCNHRPSEPSAISEWGKNPPRRCLFQVEISQSGINSSFSFYPILFVILHWYTLPHTKTHWQTKQQSFSLNRVQDSHPEVSFFFNSIKR